MIPTDPPDDPRWGRLIHLVAGELPPEEAASLRRWVDADPQRRDALARFEEVWRATAPPAVLRPDAWNPEAELRRIRSAGAAGRVIARVGPDFERIGGRRRPVVVALRVAAMLALVAGGVLLWRLRAPASPTVPAQPMAEYRTAPGERLSLRLPDGTRVMLAPGSVLRRPPSYGTGARTVHLEGEGYFTVAHDAKRPFAVYTAHAVARDLGTRFVVRAYPDESATDVVVAEGIVAVGRGAAALAASEPLSADSLVLTPRQRASVSAAGRLVLTDGVAVDRYLGWTEGQLAFEQAPLREVVRQLGRWYGIEIRLADPALGDRRLTATLEEEGAEQAMDLVATSLELSVSRSGVTYLLGPRR